MYFLAQNNQKTGPFTLDQLREMWRAGAVYPQTLYWEDGMADWQPLARLDASLLDLGLSTPAAYPVAPSAAAPEPSAYDLPAGHLPAAPPSALPVGSIFASPTSATLPSSTGPDGPHSLIAPTSLPPGGPVSPLPAPGAQMPPSAYLSVIFGFLGPGLCLFGHGIGLLPGLALSVAAVVCGHTARAAIAASGNRLPGLGVATTGLCVGYGCLGLVGLMILLSLIALIFALVVMAFAFFTGNLHH